MKTLQLERPLKPLLVFSDLHLGSFKHDLTIEKIVSVIKKVDPCIVVFNGDTFNFPCRKQAKVALNVLRRANDTAIPMYFLCGNHDPIFPDRTMLVAYNGKNILFEHGDAYAKQSSFTDFVGTYLNEKLIRYFNIDVQEWMRGIFSKTYTVNGSPIKMVKHLYKERQKILEKYSNQTEYQCVITGHTHYKEVTSLINHVLYINSGNWENCTVISPNLSVKQLDLKRDLSV